MTKRTKDDQKNKGWLIPVQRIYSSEETNENKYNEWFSDQVTSQLLNGRDPTQFKVSTKLRDI